MFQQLFIQFLLFALTFAQPIDTQAVQENAWKYGTGGGVIGFIVLVLDILVFSQSPPFCCCSPQLILSSLQRTLVDNPLVEVLKSNRPPIHKLLWCLLVFLFPIGGLIIYYLFSNRAAHGGEYEAIP